MATRKRAESNSDSADNHPTLEVNFRSRRFNFSLQAVSWSVVLACVVALGTAAMIYVMQAGNVRQSIDEFRTDVRDDLPAPSRNANGSSP